MNKEFDGLSYFIGGLSLIVSLIALFSDKNQIIMFGLGLIGLGVTFALLKLNEYFKKIDTNTKLIMEMKKEMDSYQKYIELKKDVDTIKSSIHLHKKGSISPNILLVIIIIILLYVILTSLGVINPINLSS